MAEYNYFTDGTFVAKLAAILERSLDPAQCTVAQVAKKNTSISNRDVVLEITIPKTGGGTELKEIRYNLLPIGSLANLNLTPIYCNEGLTVHQLLPTILRATGIPFTTNDLQDLPVQAGESLTDFTIPLVAKDGSRWWKGSYNLPVKRKATLRSVALGTHMGTLG